MWSVRFWSTFTVAVIVAAELSSGRPLLLANDVTTPCGAAVGHDHYAPDWTNAQKAAHEDAIEADFDGITVFENSTTKSYNCHSFAWAAAQEWIDDPGAYFDSYQVDFANGHQLTYATCLTHSPTHSAVDHAAWDYKATSKWGNLAKVTHDWDNVPDGRVWTMGGTYSDYGPVTGIYSRKCCGAGGNDCGG
jgi:hypothetical protein